jgi:Sap, sulfolipid-1-addressing protein
MVRVRVSSGTGSHHHGACGAARGGRMVLDLVIIGLAITLEPLTIVAFILILGAQRGVMKGLAFILGWMACLVAVIAAVVLVTGGNPPRPQTAPSTAVLVVKALLGALLIWIGLRQRRRMGRPRKQPGWMARLDNLSLWAAAGLGIFLQPWTLVAAGAATVVQAKLSTAGDWLALVFFCLLATSSYLILELYAAFAPAAAGARLEQIHKWINAHQDQAIVVGALVVGAWLLGNSIYVIVSSQ